MRVAGPALLACLVISTVSPGAVFASPRPRGDDASTIAPPQGYAGLAPTGATMPPFLYSGANDLDCVLCGLSPTGKKVRIMPGGTATFQVAGTTSAWVSVWGAGLPYTSSVDGGAPTQHPSTACGCWETDPLASGLVATKTHRVTFTNAASPSVSPPDAPANGIDVEAWLVDAGGSFVSTPLAIGPTDPRIEYAGAVETVADPAAPGGYAVDVPTGAAATFWLEGADALDVQAASNGATFTVSQSQKLNDWPVTVPTSGASSVLHADWGMPPGPVRLTLTATAGTLRLEQLILAAAGSSAPTALDPSTASAVPLLAAFGDSITVGTGSLGPRATSDGYADELATLVGDPLADVGLAGTTATCYGAEHTNDVVTADPGRVIVAFGINDVFAANGCSTDVTAFEAAIRSIVSRIQSTLPGVPVGLGAIVNSPKIDEATRASWNAAIEAVANDHLLQYVDASPSLSQATDYADNTHPNNGGARKIAGAWAAALPEGDADVHVNGTGPSGPVGVGDVVAFDYSVHDAGPADAPGTALTLRLPSGLAFDDATSTSGSCAMSDELVCSLGTLGDGETATVHVTATATATGDSDTVATVAAWTVDPDQTDNALALPVSVLDPAADLSVSLGADTTTPSTGQPFTYTATVTDAGPLDDPLVVLRDRLPAGLTVQSATPSAGRCQVGAASVRCSLGRVEPGSPVTVEITVVASRAGRVVDRASVAGSRPDPAPEDNATRLVLRVS